MTSPALLRKPLYGGPFGSGEYELATQPTISNGLHSVRFMVIQLAAGQVVSIAEDKREALAAARLLLRGASEPANDPEWRQTSLWTDLELVPANNSPTVQAARIPRRRRDIFNKCGGTCHYCQEPLTLDGKWHVEHQMPRALGGKDDPQNLVAACVACNLTKGDRTAVEFVLGQGRGLVNKQP